MHDAFLGKVIAVVADPCIPGQGLTGFVKAVNVAVHVCKAGSHFAVVAEIVPLSVDLLPARGENAVGEIAGDAVQLLPAGAAIQLRQALVVVGALLLALGQMLQQGVHAVSAGLFLPVPAQQLPADVVAGRFDLERGLQSFVRHNFTSPLSNLSVCSVDKAGLRHPASAALRLRLAGRCPNSDSLFPPLAAVVAVAPFWGAVEQSETERRKRQNTQ